MPTKKRELTIEADKYGNGYNVYEWSVYERSSVLAGQEKKQYIDGFNTLEEAEAAYPEAVAGYRQANNYFHHLPDPDDPSSWRMTDGEFDDGSY
jgi:hypothetical protein